MIAPQAKIEMSPRPKPRLRRRPAQSRLSLGLTVVILAAIAAVAYTAAWATATSAGYSRSRVYAEYKQLQTENQLLAADVQRLENPARVASAAEKSGMELKCQVKSLGQTPSVADLQDRIASNPQLNP